MWYKRSLKQKTSVDPGYLNYIQWCWSANLSHGARFSFPASNAVKSQWKCPMHLRPQKALARRRSTTSPVWRLWLRSWSWRPESRVTWTGERSWRRCSPRVTQRNWERQALRRRWPLVWSVKGGRRSETRWGLEV